MTDAIETFEADFTEVAACPICGNAHITDYLRLPYCKSDVQEYLLGYYTKSRNMDRAFYERVFAGKDYTLSGCDRCGALFQRNRPGPNLGELVYDHWISNEFSGIAAASALGLKDVQHFMSEAVKLTSFAMRSAGVTELPQFHALDHGMGNGFFALSLKACVVDVWGTEFSSDRLKFGRENGIRTLHVSDDLPENYFHLINTEQVMEHVPDPRRVISKLARSLAKGGILKISVPYSRSIESGDREIDWRASRYARRSPMPLAPLEHLQYYPRQCRQVIADDNGLELVNLSSWSHIRYGNNWTLRGAVRNVGRALLHGKMRNYFLLRKS
jgi:SAM-dependent methyltransferase